MRSKAILMALLAFAFGGVEAMPLTKTQVTSAARKWASSGRVLGTRIGTKVLSATEFSVTNGYSYYAVRMEGGGTIFMPSDSEMEPVIAFVSGKPDLSAKSPLRLLLDRDIRARAAMRRVAATPVTAPPVAQSSGGQPSAKLSASVLRTAAEVRQAPVVASRKWSALLSAPSSATGIGYNGAADPISEADVALITDLRVAPLLKTKWSQTTDIDAEGAPGYLNRSACYNYYTWKLTDTATIDEWPCGCTATAAAQIIRYFEYPAEGRVATYDCKVGGLVKKLTTVGGAYDWSLMPDRPGEGEAAGDDAKLEAIGRLTYDAGVALGSDYSSGLGGADPEKLAEMYRNHFGYVDGWMLWDGRSYSTGEGGLHNLSMREKVIYTNLDAGRPVQFAIYGYPKVDGVLITSSWTGHSVVGDGYGFVTLEGDDEPTAFVHVNLGWNGTDDAWYNIPEIDCATAGATISDTAGHDFLYLGGAAFNLARTEDEAGELLTGRIVDEDGAPFDGATVTLRDLEGNELATYRTAANGIYSFAVTSACEYAVTTTDDTGLLMGDLADPVAVGRTGSPLTTNFVVATEKQVGNSWGNDMVLKLPTVRIEGHGDFTTLDKAIEYARKNGLDDIVLDVINPTTLRKRQVLDFGCELTTDNGSPVDFGRDAGLVVSNKTVWIHDLAFSNAVGRTVEVLAGAALKLSGAADVGEILLTDKDNLRLAGPLTVPVLVDAPFAKGNGEAFGRFQPWSAEAGATANFLLNKHDEESGGMDYYDAGEDRHQLRWKFGAEVPAAAAAARIEPLDAACTNYRSLAVLLKYNAGGTAAVLKNTAYTNLLELSTDMLLYGAAPDITISPTATSGFTVGAGGALTFSNLTFAARSAPTAFVTVDGGAFTLEDGAVLRELDCDGEDLGSSTTGAIDVEAGTVTMRPGSAICDCWNYTISDCGGGAIWLSGEGCALNLEGGRITQCWTYQDGAGGAVCALPGASVSLSGPLTVYGNVSGADGDKYDDLSLPGAEVTVTGNLTGGYVGLSYAYDVPEEGAPFAAVAPGLQGSVTDYTLASFVYEDIYGGANRVAAVSDDGESLVWKAPDTSARTKPDEGWDVARIVRGDVTNYYYYIDGPSGAFADVQDGETIELLQPTDIIEDVPVACRVELTLAYEPYGFDIYRSAANCGFVIGAGGDLTLDGVGVSGTYGSYGTKASTPLFFVRGGALTLTNGTEIVGVRGSGNRASGAVAVSDGGTFAMSEGTAIRDCRNTFQSENDATGVGGALLVDKGTAYLHGGEISGNRAYRAAGVFVGNEGTAYVSGELVVRDNRTLAGAASDFTVEDHGQLYLDGDLTGLAAVGVEDGVKREGSLTNVFGCVSADALAACGGLSGVTNYVTSAARFFRDDNQRVVGSIVTNATDALLVWSTAVQDGIYVDEQGEIFGHVRGASVAVPTAVPGLIYDGNAKTGVVAAVEGYLLEGNVATNAGSYVATATLKPGYLWTDASSSLKNVAWLIAKATNDMSGVVFTNVTYVCDGTPKSCLVDETTLPPGVSVANYVGNGQTRVGEYVVRAQFANDAVNYAPIGDMQAMLTIIDNGGDDPQSFTVTTNDPAVTSLAFSEIRRLSETEWKLGVTNLLKDAEYALSFTDDLKTSFTIGDWFRAAASGPTNLNVTLDGEKTARFWRIHGRTTYVTNWPPVAVQLEYPNPNP